MAESKAAQGEYKQRGRSDDTETLLEILTLMGTNSAPENLWDFIKDRDDKHSACVEFLYNNAITICESNDPTLLRHYGAATAKVLSGAKDKTSYHWSSLLGIALEAVENEEQRLRHGVTPFLHGFMEAGGINFSLKICEDEKVLSDSCEDYPLYPTMRTDRVIRLVKIIIWCSMYGGKHMEMALRGVHSPIMPTVLHLLNDTSISRLSSQLFFEILRTRKGCERFREELLTEVKMLVPEDQRNLTKGLPDAEKKSVKWMHVLYSEYAKDSCDMHKTFVSALRVILTLLPDIEKKAIKSRDQLDENCHTYRQFALIKTLSRGGWFGKYLPERIYFAQTHLADHNETCLSSVLSDYLQMSAICLITMKGFGETLPGKKMWKRVWEHKTAFHNEFIRRHSECIKLLYTNDKVKICDLPIDSINVDRYTSELCCRSTQVRKCYNNTCNNFEESHGTRFKSCSGCRAACYCSAECQKAHWKEHKLLCKPVDKELPDGKKE